MTDTLSGIKGIADHLGVPVAVARRFVRLLGCPVLCVPGRSARYFASRAALDEWATRVLKKPAGTPSK